MNTKKLLMKICAAILVVAAAAMPIGISRVAALTESGALSTQARAAILLDYNTGTVIYESNELNRQPIASMVKIMTLLLAFEEADAGRLDYDSEIAVSENASSMGGSQAFLDAGSNYKVTELLQSIVVASANDSCVAIAEHISGSVESFVEKMKARAAELGMENTKFVNCTGLPAEGQYCCARDVATMARELFSHEKFFEYSGVWMYDFAHPSGRTTRLTNTNKLIRAYEGCDGGKTGFTNEAMSCLAATAKRGDTRLVSVVVGAADSKKRNAEICKLFNYGFANYETKEVVKAGDKLEAPVFVDGGKTDCVDGVYAKSYFVFDKKPAASEYKISISIDSVKAPVCTGDVIGKAIITRGEETVGEVEIVSAADVEKKGYIDIVDEFISKW